MDSIGQVLRKAREHKRMTIAEVATATKANGQYIQAIEADDFSVFPASIYAAGFIRLYAECVGLNPQPLIQVYHSRAISEVKTPPPRVRELKPAPVKGPRKSWPWPTIQWSAWSKYLRWPTVTIRRVSLTQLRLPVETWKAILTAMGMLLLVVVTVFVFLWHSAGKHAPTLSSTAQWLQEPPTPYLEENMEARGQK